MKRFLFRILVGSIFFIVVYPVAIFALGSFLPKYFKNIKQTKGGYGHLWSRLREIEKSPDADILILGSSTAYRGIDTRSFDSLGLKAFNLGSSAQTPLQSAYLLEKFIDKVNPSVVIWDVNPYTFHNSGYESFVDVCSNLGADMELAKQLIVMKELQGINTLLFVEMSQLFSNYYNYNEPIKKRKDTYIGGGFVETEMKIFDGNYEVEPINLEFRHYQKESFEQSLKYLTEKNINVVLVFAPIYEKTYTSFLNRVEVNNYFESMVRSYNLKGYFNFNEMKVPGLNEKLHFYDDYHLNQEGVKLYDSYLVRVVSDTINLR
jgi:hypothetical protein